MSDLKHMINSMVAGIKMDTDHTFSSIDLELKDLDKKLADTEALFVQGIEAIRHHRGRINKVLTGQPNQAPFVEEQPIPRIATQGPRRQ
jgi:hypothetical protein